MQNVQINNPQAYIPVRKPRKTPSALKKSKNKENQFVDIPPYNPAMASASEAANYQMKKRPKSKENVDRRMIVQEIMGIRTKLDGFLDMLHQESDMPGPCRQGSSYSTKELKRFANQQE